MGQSNGISCKSQHCHCTEQTQELEASFDKKEPTVPDDIYMEELLSSEPAIPVVERDKNKKEKAKIDAEKAKIDAKLENDKKVKETQKEIESARQDFQRRSKFVDVEASEHEAFFAKRIEEQRRIAEEARRTSEMKRSSSSLAEKELRKTAEKMLTSCKEQGQRTVEHAEEQRRTRETEATKQLNEAKAERQRLQAEAERQRAEAERERLSSLAQRQKMVEATSREGTADVSIMSNSDWSRRGSPDRSTNVDGSTTSTCAEQDARKDQFFSGPET